MDGEREEHKEEENPHIELRQVEQLVDLAYSPLEMSASWQGTRHGNDAYRSLNMLPCLG
jgi:hypothetical protein